MLHIHQYSQTIQIENIKKAEEYGWQTQNTDACTYTFIKKKR